jgi:hypothetical protein
MGWIGHVECYGREVHEVFWWGNLKERDNLDDLGIDGRIIIK